MRGSLTIKIGLVAVGFTGLFFMWVLRLDYHQAELHIQQEFAQRAIDTPRVLLVATCVGDGGKVTAVVNHYLALRKQGIPVVLLTVHESVLVAKMQQLGAPVVSCNAFRISYKNYMWQPGLERAMAKIVAKYSCTIIHLNGLKESVAAGKIAKNNAAIRVVYTHHETDSLPPYLLPHVDGVVCVGEPFYRKLQDAYDAGVTPRRNYVWIPPFFDSKRFLDFTTTEPHNAYFKRVFNTEFGEGPLLCMVANFYGLAHKNHPLLFEAVRIVMQEYHIPLQVVCVGDGGTRAYCQELVHKLGLQKSIHFLGATPEAPALLYYADINILTSKSDAFPIVMLEGALMKKATIASSGVGSVGSLIRDQDTGLVFTSGDARACADCIVKILNDAALQERLGTNLFNEVITNYTQDVLVTRLLNFYQKLLLIPRDNNRV